MKQFSILILLLLLTALLLLYPNPYTLTPAYAQSCLLQTTDARGVNIARVTNGLISTSGFPEIGNKFSSNTGQCALGNQVPFVPYKMDTYDSIKSKHFDQANLRSYQKITLSGDQTQATAISAIDLVSLPNLCP